MALKKDGKLQRLKEDPSRTEHRQFLRHLDFATFDYVNLTNLLHPGFQDEHVTNRCQGFLTAGPQPRQKTLETRLRQLDYKR